MVRFARVDGDSGLNPVAARVRIRRMLPVDLDAVLAVERRAYPHPWSEQNFHDCLGAGYQCHLLVRDEQIFGHGIMMLAAGEGHVLNLCVAPDWQGRGLGRKMLRHLLVIARQRNCKMLFLEARASNRVAAGLYESEGFNEIGRRNAYYPATGGREDALVFALNLLPVDSGSSLTNPHD